MFNGIGGWGRGMREEIVMLPNSKDNLHIQQVKTNLPITSRMVIIQSNFVNLKSLGTKGFVSKHRKFKL